MTKVRFVMIFADNLRALMDSAGETTITLGKELNVSDESVSNWRKGKSVPKVDIALKIAKYFGCSLDELLVAPINTEQNIALPLVGVVSAGPFDILNEDEWDETRSVQCRLLAGRPKQECVTMEVAGDSMEPYLLEGDVLVVHRQTYAVNGNIVVVYDPNLGGYTVKRYKQNGDAVVLQPYNEAYKPMVYNNPKEQELHLYGVCVGLERKLV